MTKSSFTRADRLASFDPRGTVFAEYTALSNAHKSVNLGQGFPNLPVSDFILQGLHQAIDCKTLKHQYTRSEGHPNLADALSKYYSPLLNRSINPQTELITTVGASEGIFSAVQAFINPGDEVILMQPFYDSYPASVRLAGGIPVTVSLKPSIKSGKVTSASEWKLDMSELENAVSEKTRMIFVNNPHNPLGKVFSEEELLEIARIAKKYNLLVLADEVYETLVYEDHSTHFVKFASLPDMFERTITVGSAGKMFGVTGWKIGWVLAPADITRSIWLVHQFVPFCVASPLQDAVANALVSTMRGTGSGATYFQDTKTLYKHLRDSLYKTLEKIGFNPCLPQGSYFIVCDISHLPLESNEDFSKFLTKKVGVTSIPVSAFYVSSPEDQATGNKYIRFAFCKDEDTLREAQARLEKYFVKA